MTKSFALWPDAGDRRNRGPGDTPPREAPRPVGRAAGRRRGADKTKFGPLTLDKNAILLVVSLTKMTIRQLTYFLRIVDLKSFSKAAAYLHVAQPALGLQVRKLEDEFEKLHATAYLQGRRQAYREADTLMHTPDMSAFDLSDEDNRLRDAYGRNRFGQGCLLARRLVERGVKFVEVGLGGWDTHQDNFNQTRSLLNVLDPAFATLIRDLGQRGLLKETLVVWLGEFGRTPRINANNGRDHWPTC
ncbi:MAG: DUF1501 domain-containing protein, partial [Proteobacteria bacterium]|nr:DUF1501 domain-containing protein [Pseudomonadota bacterium]